MPNSSHRSKRNHEKYSIFLLHKYYTCTLTLGYEPFDFLIDKVTLKACPFKAVGPPTEFQTPYFKNIVKVYIFKLYRDNPMHF